MIGPVQMSRALKGRHSMVEPQELSTENRAKLINQRKNTHWSKLLKYGGYKYHYALFKKNLSEKKLLLINSVTDFSWSDYSFMALHLFSLTYKNRAVSLNFIFLIKNIAQVLFCISTNSGNLFVEATVYQIHRVSLHSCQGLYVGFLPFYFASRFY